MKKLIILSMALVFLCGCKDVRNAMKHARSSIIGLNREITLYAADGRVIRQWQTRAKVEDKGGTCWFICDGKAYTVSGTFVVAEK